MSNILITSAGRRVSLVKAFQAELKKHLSDNSAVFCTDVKPELSAACNVSDKYYRVPPATNDNYIDSLLDISLANNVKVIVPTIDTELKILAQNKNRFLENGIICLCPDLDFVNICRDKRLTNEFFITRNIEVPQEYTRDNYRFPLFIKPFDGSSSKNIHIINNLKDLSEDLLKNPDLMFLEYITPGKFDEYTLDIYYNRNSKICCIVPRLRIEIRTGEISKGITLKNSLITFIKEKLDNISSIVGCITLQLFADKDISQVFGIEINPRFGGGYPLSYNAGANFPSFIIREYILDEEISYTEDWQENMLMLRYDDEIIINNFSPK